MTNTLDFEVSVPAEHSALQGFAQRLRALMSERGDTQTELASALGIAQRSVSAYLASEAFPQLGTFVAIGERYGVSLDWLAGLTNAREPRGELVAVVDDELLRRFLAGEEIAGRIQLTRRIPPGRLVTQAELDRIAKSAQPHHEGPSGQPLGDG